MAIKLATAKRKDGTELHFRTSMEAVSGLSTALAGKQPNLTQAQLDAVNSGATAALVGKITTNETNISGINSQIAELPDKAFVNSTVQTMSAAPISYDVAGNPFPTKADLDNAATYYNGGVAKTPDEHDYATVLADETHGGAQTRYVFSHGVWTFQYLVNDQPFTAAQNAAINSGITSAQVGQLDALVAGNGDLLSKVEAAGTYATKDYVEGLGTVYIVENGADLSGFGDEDLIIELDA